MSSASQPLAVPRVSIAALARDYSVLIKARVTTLIVMTAWAGAYFAAAKSGVALLSWTLLHALIGIALGNALIRGRSFGNGVHWTVLEALALSPILGFILAGALYFGLRRVAHDRHLYEPAGDRAPIWWMRGILILTCTGVSFAHVPMTARRASG